MKHYSSFGVPIHNISLLLDYKSTQEKLCQSPDSFRLGSPSDVEVGVVGGGELGEGGTRTCSTEQVSITLSIVFKGQAVRGDVSILRNCNVSDCLCCLLVCAWEWMSVLACIHILQALIQVKRSHFLA